MTRHRLQRQNQQPKSGGTGAKNSIDKPGSRTLCRRRRPPLVPYERPVSCRLSRRSRNEYELDNLRETGGEVGQSYAFPLFESYAASHNDFGIRRNTLSHLNVPSHWSNTCAHRGEDPDQLCGQDCVKSMDTRIRAKSMLASDMDQIGIVDNNGFLRERSASVVKPDRRLAKLFGQTSCTATFPRRTKRHQALMTVWTDRHLLDEIHQKQLKLLLGRKSLTSWSFDAFMFDRITKGTNLATLCLQILDVTGILRHFSIDPLVAWSFFMTVEHGYHSSNPYHNVVHASDVTQALFCILHEEPIKKNLTPLELLAAIVGAVCHDIDHPGRNGKFLIENNCHLALLYSDSSVLEHHHWRTALSCMHKSGLMEQLSKDSTKFDETEFVSTMRDIILATDISRQSEFLDRLRREVDKCLVTRFGQDVLAMPPSSRAGLASSAITDELAVNKELRKLVLQVAMKCADISNPCRTWPVSRLWSHRACEEFFRQGDAERLLGMSVTPSYDRYTTTMARVQTSFYRVVAVPLFEEWSHVMATPLTTTMMRNMASNQARWDLILQQEELNVISPCPCGSSSTLGSTATLSVSCCSCTTTRSTSGSTETTATATSSSSASTSTSSSTSTSTSISEDHNSRDTSDHTPRPPGPGGKSGPAFNHDDQAPDDRGMSFGRNQLPMAGVQCPYGMHCPYVHLSRLQCDRYMPLAVNALVESESGMSSTNSNIVYSFPYIPLDECVAANSFRRRHSVPVYDCIASQCDPPASTSSHNNSTNATYQQQQQQQQQANKEYQPRKTRACSEDASVYNKLLDVHNHHPLWNVKNRDLIERAFEVSSLQNHRHHYNSESVDYDMQAVSLIGARQATSWLWPWHQSSLSYRSSGGRRKLSNSRRQSSVASSSLISAMSCSYDEERSSLAGLSSFDTDSETSSVNKFGLYSECMFNWSTLPQPAANCSLLESDNEYYVGLKPLFRLDSPLDGAPDEEYMLVCRSDKRIDDDKENVETTVHSLVVPTIQRRGSAPSTLFRNDDHLIGTRRPPPTANQQSAAHQPQANEVGFPLAENLDRTNRSPVNGECVETGITCELKDRLALISQKRRGSLPTVLQSDIFFKHQHQVNMRRRYVGTVSAASPAPQRYMPGVGRGINHRVTDQLPPRSNVMLDRSRCVQNHHKHHPLSCLDSYSEESTPSSPSDKDPDSPLEDGSLTVLTDTADHLPDVWTKFTDDCMHAICLSETDSGNPCTTTTGNCASAAAAAVESVL